MSTLLPGKKSSMLLHVRSLVHVFECGPLPPYIHLASIWHHLCDRCSQAFSVFCTLPLPCIILNANRRTKNGGGLGTRLSTYTQGPGQAREWWNSTVSTDPWHSLLLHVHVMSSQDNKRTNTTVTISVIKFLSIDKLLMKSRSFAFVPRACWRRKTLSSL